MLEWRADPLIAGIVPGGRSKDRKEQRGCQVFVTTWWLLSEFKWTYCKSVELPLMDVCACCKTPAVFSVLFSVISSISKHWARLFDLHFCHLCRIMWIILVFILAAAGPGGIWGCQLPQDWRPQTEACRAELAQIIVFAKVLALHEESYSAYNYLPWHHDTDLFFSAEIELLCDQAWGSMLEVPAGSRFNVTGLGYFPCFSYSVTKNNNYYFFLRWDAMQALRTHA